MIATPGIVSAFSGLFGMAGLILRVDCGPTALTGDWSQNRPAFAVEDALRLVADGVIAMGIVGAEGESSSIHALAQLSAECERWGMVLVAEMLPRDFPPEMPPRTRSWWRRAWGGIGSRRDQDSIQRQPRQLPRRRRFLLSACGCPWWIPARS